MRNTHKKANMLLKRCSTNVVNIRDEPKPASHEAKSSEKLTSKPFCYYNRKVNTESGEIGYSDSKPSTRKLYLLPKGHLEKSQKLNRKSYSREFQQSKILDGRSFELANRFTLTDFNQTDLRNQSSFRLGSAFLKKNYRKPANNQRITANHSGNLHPSSNSKKYRSPYDKTIKRGLENNYMKPIEIKSILKPKMQRRIMTEMSDYDSIPLNFDLPRHKQTSSKHPIRNSSANNILATPDRELEIIEQIGQGTFGKVYKGRYGPQGDIVAVKKVLQDRKYKSRELQILKTLKSQFTMGIINHFTSYEQNHGQKEEYLNIIMEHCDCNLYEYLGRHKNLSGTMLKIILYQMFRGLLYIHSLGICHRDIKPHNMLVKHGRICICDFGSAKILKKDQVNLSYICSRCYRAPELIFGSRHYSTKIDVWAAGCIILEIINKVPLFIGENSLDHLVQVIKVMGTPSKSEVIAMNSDYDLREYDFPQIPRRQWFQMFPDSDSKLIDLISKIMLYSPHLRLTAAEALSHEYFDDIRLEQNQTQIRLLTKTNGFFDFTTEQLKIIGGSKLIPKWHSTRNKRESRGSLPR